MSRSCQQNRPPLRMKNVDVLFKAMALDFQPRNKTGKGTQVSCLMLVPKCGACDKVAGLSKQGSAQCPLCAEITDPF